MKEIINEIKVLTDIDRSITQVYNTLKELGYDVEFSKENTLYALDVKHSKHSVSVVYDSTANKIFIDYALNKNDDMVNALDNIPIAIPSTVIVDCVQRFIG